MSESFLCDAAIISGVVGGVLAIGGKLFVDGVLNPTEPLLLEAVLDREFKVWRGLDVDPRSHAAGAFLCRQFLVALDSHAVDIPVSATIILDLGASVDQCSLDAVVNDERQLFELVGKDIAHQIAPVRKAHHSAIVLMKRVSATAAAISSSQMFIASPQRLFDEAYNIQIIWKGKLDFKIILIVPRRERHYGPRNQN